MPFFDFPWISLIYDLSSTHFLASSPSKAREKRPGDEVDICPPEA